MISRWCLLHIQYYYRGYREVLLGEGGEGAVMFVYSNGIQIYITVHHSVQVREGIDLNSETKINKRTDIFSKYNFFLTLGLYDITFCIPHLPAEGDGKLIFSNDRGDPLAGLLEGVLCQLLLQRTSPKTTAWSLKGQCLEIFDPFW